MWVRTARSIRMASSGAAGLAAAAICANAFVGRSAFNAAALDKNSLAAAAAPIAPLGEVSGPLALETDFDVAVVGGGIIGLATAREILKRYPHMKVAVLEKEKEVGPHQSSHNSGGEF